MRAQISEHDDKIAEMIVKSKQMPNCFGGIKFRGVNDILEIERKILIDNIQYSVREGMHKPIMTYHDINDSINEKE